MIKHAAFLAGLLTLALVMVVMSETTFLAPYKRVLLARHLWTIVGALLVIFLNLFAAGYSLARVLFLRDTGRKLAHVEKQIAWNTGDAIVRDLSARLKEDEA